MSKKILANDLSLEILNEKSNSTLRKYVYRRKNINIKYQKINNNTKQFITTNQNLKKIVIFIIDNLLMPMINEIIKIKGKFNKYLMSNFDFDF